jgi:hypothetical protein
MLVPPQGLCSIRHEICSLIIMRPQSRQFIRPSAVLCFLPRSSQRPTTSSVVAPPHNIHLDLGLHRGYHTSPAFAAETWHTQVRCKQPKLLPSSTDITLLINNSNYLRCYSGKRTDDRMIAPCRITSNQCRCPYFPQL